MKQRKLMQSKKTSQWDLKDSGLVNRLSDNSENSEEDDDDEEEDDDDDIRVPTIQG